MKTVPLGEVVHIISGATPKTSKDEYWNGPVPWVTPADLSKLGDAYIGHTPRTLTDAGLRSCAATLLPPGSVLLSSRAPIGHVAVNTVPMATNQGFKSLVPGPKIHSKFLYHWIRANRDYLQSLGNGATFKELSKRTVEQIQVPLPDVSEQQRIAAILDHADALRAKRRQVLAHLDALPQSIFHNMFGDPVRNPRDLSLRRLQELGSLDRGVSKHRPRNDPALLGGVHPLIQTGDVANSAGYIESFSTTYSDLGLAQSRMWPAGTLCITIAANIAKTGILTFNACFPDSVVGFSSDPETTTFVRVWLGFLQATLEASAPQSAQKNINLAVLRGLEVPVPRRVELEEFASRVDQVHKQQATARLTLAAGDELFASLQSRAFKGEL